jgi:hypothetical protein
VFFCCPFSFTFCVPTGLKARVEFFLRDVHDFALFRADAGPDAALL